MHPELFTIPGINLTIPSYGAMTLIGFLAATFWMMHLAKRAKTDPDIVLNLGFLILIFGMLSARIFYVIHYWDKYFADQPSQAFNIRAGGFEVYGGLIGGFIACTLYLRLKRLSWRLYTDMVTPPLLLAMGIGRIGCFLFGCCWGAPAPDGMAWAVQFPCASPPHLRQWAQRIATVPAELTLINPAMLASPMPRKALSQSRDELQTKMDDAKAALAEAQAAGDKKKLDTARLKHTIAELTLKPILDHLNAFEITPDELKALAKRNEYHSSPLHPAQIYSAIGPMLLAWLTCAYFYRRKRHGTVLVLGALLYAFERFIEEIVRIDNPVDTFGLTVSQAISIAVFVVMLSWYMILQKMPLRSPRAVAFVPAETST